MSKKTKQEIPTQLVVVGDGDRTFLGLTHLDADGLTQLLASGQPLELYGAIEIRHNDVSLQDPAGGPQRIVTISRGTTIDAGVQAIPVLRLLFRRWYLVGELDQVARDAFDLLYRATLAQAHAEYEVLRERLAERARQAEAETVAPEPGKDPG